MTINPDKLMAFSSGRMPVRVTPRECTLYALSIGIGMDPLDPLQLSFVTGAAPRPFPTMLAVLGWPGRMTNPEFGIDHRRVVATDMDIAWRKPLSVDAELTSVSHVAGIIDKGAGQAAIILMERSLTDADGHEIATVRNGVMARGQGGFGGSSEGGEPLHAMPERAPDLSCDLPTPPNLALLFSLHGDTNPIHSDPQLAHKAGFDKPLLHGACNFGIAAHALARTAAGGDVARFARMRARFAKPFFPGDTFRTEMWTDGNHVSFRCRSVQRGDVILDHGLLELHGEASAS